MATVNRHHGQYTYDCLFYKLFIDNFIQKAHMEMLARNQYMAGENRDPTKCSLFYFALGKVKLVHGLWRQAAWHPEQNAMLKFLNNDFSLARWRTAALKNAFALLSKRRFGKIFTELDG